MAKERGSKAAQIITVTQFCEVLKGTPIVNEATGKTVTKKDAALQIWSGTLKGDKQKEEVFKAGVVPNLLKLLDIGDTDERFASVGVLSVIVSSEKHITEVVSNRTIALVSALLAGDHDRSKLPAARFLAFIALRVEYANKVADAALVPLAKVLMHEGPGWAQTPALQIAASVAIKALIENVAGESGEVKAARRAALVQAGCVLALVHMVCSAPRLPRPDVYPALPPSVGKKGKKASSVGAKKGKKDGSAETSPQGQKDAVATAASACLRFLATSPGFVRELSGTKALPELVEACACAGAEQSAYVAGILWEVCADEALAREAVDAGAVPALLHVVSRFLSAAASGGKKKGGEKKGDKEVKMPDKKKAAAAGPPPPNHAGMAVCNAAGALHHLTFLDDAKLQMGEVGVPILYAATRLGNAQTYANATGALWNVGLDINNTAALLAMAAPAFLVEPVPSSWLMDNSKAVLGLGSDDDDAEDEPDEPVSPSHVQQQRTFVTSYRPVPV